MPNQPIQVVTNPQRLQQPRDKKPPATAGTDFFAGNDEGFARHQRRLVEQIRGIIETLSAPKYQTEFGGLGYVRVRMGARAIAKSHRPQKRIFRKTSTPHVATDGVGEPIFACTPESLDQVLDRVLAAEIHVPTKIRADTGEVVPNPSRGRCEVSGIGSIDLWIEADKRSFSASEAVDWLSRSGTGGRYEVDLFPSRGSTTQGSLASAGLYSARALQSALESEPVDAFAQPMHGIGAGRSLAVGVVGRDASRRLELGILTEDVGTKLRAKAIQGLSRDVDEHARVLHALGRNPLVRAISLPAIPSARPVETEPRDELPLPKRQALPQVPGAASSIVGIIDGGIGAVLDPWVVHRWGLLTDADTDAEHGTFIGGLLVGAGAMNPKMLDAARPACRLVDINVLPSDPGSTGSSFERYFPGGTPEFFDEIEGAVREMRQDHGVRVFNLSINFDGPGDDSRYGSAARRLDEIARAYDVIFVISAGNLNPNDQRAEWPTDPTIALAALAREGRTTISEPAESLFNISVSALNPSGLIDQVPFALTRYSRRGPGLRGATKPDLAHIGGSGTADPSNGTGLCSVDEAGALTTAAGTSFAAPLVARELADLDAAITGTAPRETLIALLVHEASMPEQLRRAPVGAIATDLAGFGVPSQTHNTLERPDSEIVMVFNSTVSSGEEHSLNFAWPAALTDNGRCRGYARLTLVARPVLAYEHGDERIRVNIDAKLMQENDEGGFNNVLKPVYHPDAMANPRSEKELLREAHKWQVVKSFETPKMRGRGRSSTWKFLVEYLTRAEEELPIAGVEFAAVLTISDPKGEAPVFQQMRQQLGTLGIRTADIRAGVQARVIAGS